MEQIKKNWETIKSTTLELKDFALVIGFVLTLIGLVRNGYHIYLRLDNFLMWGLIVLAIGILRPELLKYAHKVWMTFGFLMSKIMSTVMLFLIYVLVFVPIGMLLKIIGKQLMEKPNSKLQSYWSISTKVNKNYQKQF